MKDLKNFFWGALIAKRRNTLNIARAPRKQKKTEACGERSAERSRRGLSRAAGQSLVEFAVVGPLLVFIFLALIEIGWFMRSVQVVTAESREAARFGVRSDIAEHTLAGDFTPILDHFNETMQVNSGFYPVYGGEEANTSLYIHRLDVTIVETTTVELCTPPATGYVVGASQVPTYSVRFGVERESHVVDDAELYTRLVQDETNFLCNQAQRDPDAWRGPHSVLVVELWYEQEQLLGFPLFTILGARYPVHAETQMRLR